jgi:hypothetical protein
MILNSKLKTYLRATMERLEENPKEIARLFSTYWKPTSSRPDTEFTIAPDRLKIAQDALAKFKVDKTHHINEETIRTIAKFALGSGFNEDLVIQLAERRPTLKRYFTKNVLKNYFWANLLKKDSLIQALLHEEMTSDLSSLGIHLSDLAAPLLAVSKAKITPDLFTTNRPSSAPRWFRIRQEFSACMFGALLCMYARNKDDLGIKKILDIFESENFLLHSRLKLDSKNSLSYIPSSLCWWMIGTLAVWKNSTEFRGRAINIISSLSESVFGDPRHSQNKGKWALVNYIAKDELNRYCKSLNRADLEYFFNLPDVVNENRSSFFLEYIDECSWTQVILKRSFHEEIKSQHSQLRDEEKAILDRTFVFPGTSSHHVFVMGFERGVVIEGHDTGFRTYCLSIPAYSSEISKLLERKKDDDYNDANYVTANSSRLREALNLLCQRSGDVNRANDYASSYTHTPRVWELNVKKHLEQVWR